MPGWKRGWRTRYEGPRAPAEPLPGTGFRLVEAGQRPNIAIQVVPFSAGAHEGLRGGAFIVADFYGAVTIPCQDAASSGQIIEDAAHVKPWRSPGTCSGWMLYRAQPPSAS